MRRQALTGSRVRDRRLLLGLKQSDLARTVGISSAYLNLIEHNRRRVGAELLQALADAADSRAKRLKSGDMASMEARLKACEGSIAVIAQRLSVVMDAVLAKTDATQRDVQSSLGKDAARSAEVRKREGTTVVESSYEHPFQGVTTSRACLMRRAVETWALATRAST